MYTKPNNLGKYQSSIWDAYANILNPPERMPWQVEDNPAPVIQSDVDLAKGYMSGAIPLPSEESLLAKHEGYLGRRTGNAIKPFAFVLGGAALGGALGAGAGATEGLATTAATEGAGTLGGSVADAVWSANATVNPAISTALQNTGMLGGTAVNGGGIFDTLKSGYDIYNKGSKVVGALQGLSGGQQQPNQQQLMPPRGNQNMNLQDIMNLFGGGQGQQQGNSNPLMQLLGGGIDMATSNKQQGIMGDAYTQAQQMLSTPTADQLKYRNMLETQMQHQPTAFTDKMAAFKPMTEAEFASSPSYQFALGQGQQALERSQAAKGMAGSGGAAQELMQFGQGLASQGYGQQFNRDLGAYGANLNAYGANLNAHNTNNSTWANTTGMLSNLSGIGSDSMMRESGARTLVAGAGMQASLLGDMARAGTMGLGGYLGGQGGGQAQAQQQGNIGQSLTGLTNAAGLDGIYNHLNKAGNIYQGIVDPNATTGFANQSGIDSSWFGGMDLYDTGSQYDPGYNPALADMIWGTSGDTYDVGGNTSWLSSLFDWS